MTIKVVGVANGESFPCRVLFDWYIPLAFKGYVGDGIGGARYITIAAHDREVLELKVGPRSVMLQSFLWVFGNNAPTDGFSMELPGEPGLPILDLPNDPAFSAGRIGWSDVKSPVALCQPGRHADIRIGTARTFDRCLLHGRVRFLILGDELVGLRVAHLTDEERRGLEDYLARQAAPVD